MIAHLVAVALPATLRKMPEWLVASIPARMYVLCPREV
jgi:hypothetical protein